MIRKLTLAVGFAAGYVLGAKAGTERYDQIVAKGRELLGQPAVQDFTSKATTTASAAADKAKSTVNEKVEAVSDKVGSSSSSSSSSGSGAPVDLGATTSTTSTYTTAPATPAESLGTGGIGTGPIVGASPSGTAPDVV